MTETDLRKKKARAYIRKHRYGITEEQYDELLATQDNKCAVCKTEFMEGIGPNIDHDHNCCPGAKSCGACLRGLLCSNCLTLASLVETRFRYIDEMFVYLHYHLINGGRNK